MYWDGSRLGASDPRPTVEGASVTVSSILEGVSRSEMVVWITPCSWTWLSFSDSVGTWYGAVSLGGSSISYHIGSCDDEGFAGGVKKLSKGRTSTRVCVEEVSPCSVVGTPSFKQVAPESADAHTPPFVLQQHEQHSRDCSHFCPLTRHVSGSWESTLQRGMVGATVGDVEGISVTGAAVGSSDPSFSGHCFFPDLFLDDDDDDDDDDFFLDDDFLPLFPLLTHSSLSSLDDELAFPLFPLFPSVLAF